MKRFSSKELFDYGILMGRVAREQVCVTMPADHCDVPGDYREREFVKAMADTGRLGFAEDALDAAEQLGHA